MSNYIGNPRLLAGPHGRPYQALGDTDEAQARRELAAMKSDLRAWRRARKVNSEIASGKRPRKSKSSIPRNWTLEQELANSLFGLLSQVYDAQLLPDPDLRKDPMAAVRLADIVLDGKLPANVGGPTAQGLIPLLVGAVAAVVLLGYVATVRTKAAAAKEEERLRCLREGDLAAKIACSEPSSLIAFAAIGYAAYWTWTKGGLGAKVTEKIGKL